MVEQFRHDAASSDPGGSYSGAGRGAKGWLRRAVAMAAEFVYPPQCPSCRAELELAGGLCPSCWRDAVFLAPPSCRKCAAPLGADLGAYGVCDDCTVEPPKWSEGRAALLYEGVGRKLVLGLKHGDRLDIAPLAAGWMARTGGDVLDRADMIAPVPLHWMRMAQRRFNQAGELARSLAVCTNKQRFLALDLLNRRRSTDTQDGKSRIERRENLAGVIKVNVNWLDQIKGANVLLVDDVMTTGATLSECADICLDAGAADVNVIVMARVARGDWPA